MLRVQLPGLLTGAGVLLLVAGVVWALRVPKPVMHGAQPDSPEAVQP